MRFQVLGSLLVAVLLVLGTVAVVSATLNISSVCAAGDTSGSSGGSGGSGGSGKGRGGGG
ncbi:MAG: hypothetical protein JWR88_573 [Pseudonocardia sp.]|jgi:hypothetical protein|nr:hypothetical protein [Pseudonocardia sp.]